MLKKFILLMWNTINDKPSNINFIEFLLKKWFIYLFKILLSKPQLKPTT